MVTTVEQKNKRGKLLPTPPLPDNARKVVLTDKSRILS